MINEIDEIIEQLRSDMEYLGVSQADVASAVGVSAKTIGNYLNGVTVDKENIRKMQKYLRGEEFYRGYCFQNKNEFSVIFDDVWSRLKDIMSASEICSSLGLTLSEVNHIKEKKKRLDVRRQYDILTRLYELCHDYTGEYITGFEAIGGKLCNILGLEFAQPVVDKFADLLNDTFAGLDFQISVEELSEAAGISVEDLNDLQSCNECPFDIWKKCDILDIIRNMCRKRESEASLSVYRKLCWMLLNYDENEPPEARRYYSDMRKRNISDFKKYPARLQNIILSHIDIFFDLAEYERNCIFWDYINSYPVAAELGLPERNEEVAEFDYYRAIVELFEDLSKGDKKRALDWMEARFVMPFPHWQNNEGMFDFKLAAQCFDMAVITWNNNPASIARGGREQEEGETAPRNVYSPEARNAYSLEAGIWEYYNSSRVRYKLSLGPQEWCLWAMMITAVGTNTDLNPLINKIIEMLS